MTLERFCVVMGMLLLVELGLLFHIQPRHPSPRRGEEQGGGRQAIALPSTPPAAPSPQPSPPEGERELQLAVTAATKPATPKPTPKPVEPATIPGASDCEHPDDPLCGLPELR